MKKMTQKELTRLVRRAQSQDREAFSRLYEYTHSAQFFTALSILKNREQAEEAIQTVYMQALDKLPGLKSPEAFLTWLTKITCNHCLYLYNRAAHTQDPLDETALSSLPDPSPEACPEEFAIHNEKQNAVLRIIDSLSAEHRTVILLKYYHNRKLKEIARIMNCSEGTVKSRLYYAQKHLRSKLYSQGIRSSADFHGVGLLISSALCQTAGSPWPGPERSGGNQKRTALALALIAFTLLAGAGSAHRTAPSSEAAVKDIVPPSMTSFRYEEGSLFIVLDDDVSGVDVQNLRAYTEDHKSVPVYPDPHLPGRFMLDCASGRSVTLSIADQAGNSCEYVVDVGDFYTVKP